MKAQAQKIGDGVYWIGVLDWDLRTYHGYTLNGTTYNAYIVFGEKVAVIDNAYPGKTEEMMARIVWKRFDAPIYCSAIAEKGLLRHYPKLEGADFNIVGTGDSLDLGGKTLAFLDAFLLHWPDSMFTLLAEDGILFPNDAFGQHFGQHLCYAKRLDTDIPETILMDAAQKFYGNLITPLSKKVLNKFQEIIDLGLLEQVKMIAPSHGQIWTDPMKIIGAYQDWATGKGAKDKVTIVYDTMHYSTQTMAHEVAEGIISQGYDVEMYFLHEDERSEIVKSILTSKAVAFGIPTINDFPFPSMGDIIYYLKGLHFNRTGFKRPAITFGSMGGRGGSVEFIANELTECGFDVIDQEEIYYVPDDENKERAFELGVKVVEAAKKLEL